MLSRRLGFGFLIRTALIITLVAGTVSTSIARPNPAHAEDRSEPQLTAEYIDRIVDAVEDNREPYRKLLGDELLTETVEYLTAIRDYTDLLTSANESDPGVWAAATALNDCFRAIEDSSEGFTREKAEWLIKGFEDLGTAIDVVTLLPFGAVGEFIGSVATWHVFAELVKTAYGQAWEWLEYFAWYQDNGEIRDRIWNQYGFLKVQSGFLLEQPPYEFVQTQLGNPVNGTLPQIQYYLGDFGTASDSEKLFFRYSLVSRNLDPTDYMLVFVFEGRYTYYNNASLRIRFGDYMSWATLIESAPFSVSSPDANWELITDIPKPLIDNAPTSRGTLQLTLYRDNTMCETLNLPFIMNTGDTTAPVVDHGPTVTYVEAGSAIIDWTTNEESSSRVDYGTTVGYGPKEIDPDMTTEHSVVLSGLDDTVDYHFKVSSSDRSGNTYVSQDFSFRLTDLIDTTPPAFSEGPEVLSTTASSAVIRWSNDEPTTGTLEYGIDPVLGGMKQDPTFRYDHEGVVIYNLTPETDYFGRVTSVDRAGNQSTSAVFTFRTLSAATEPRLLLEKQETIGGPNEADVHIVSVNQSGKLEISVTGVPSINMKADLFRNPTDTVAIASGGYSSLFGQPASLVPVYIDPSQVGAYYIKVFDYAGNDFSQTPYTITAAFTPRDTVYFLDEPNDLSSQPTSLGLNQPYQSYIYRPTHATAQDYTNNYRGDTDWYQLSVTQAGKLEILVTAVPGINMMAELFRNPADTSAIASGGQSSLFGQQASVVPVYIDPSQVGAYYIKVFDYAGNAFSQTPYTITATFTPRSTVYFLDEPNDASGQPTSLGLNQPYQSYIYRPTHATAQDYTNSYSGDTDWYQLSVTQAGKLEILVTAVPGINMMAELFRNPADGAIVSGGQSSLFGQQASVVPVYIDPSQVGAYYIKVFDYAGNAFSQTPYTITATFTPRSTVYFLDEPNDASNEPTSLGLNQPYQSYIYRPTHATAQDYTNNYRGDTDWYQLSVTQAGKLEILVTAVPGINMMAELFRNPADGAIASGGQSSLFGQQASVVPVYIDPSQVGAYYIKVFDYAGNAFSQTPYTITATFTPRSTVYFLDEPNDASNEPTSLGLNQPYQSYIYRPTHATAQDYTNNYRGDTDWYQLSVTQAGKLEILVTAVPGINMMAELFRNPTDGAIASGGQSSLFGQQASVVPVYIDPSQVGAYYIKVFDYAGNAFSQTPYNITAGFLPDLRIDSISPNQGNRGDSLGIIIAGSDLLGVSSLSCGVGIAVESFSAGSDSQITGIITIDALAALGPRDVTVTSAEGTAVLTGGFTVGQPQPEMTWYLDSETHSPAYVMGQTAGGQTGIVSVPARVGNVNGEVIWYSNNATASSVTFPAGAWTIYLETPEDWADQCLVSVGAWDPDGSPGGFQEFPANPPSKSYAGGILTVQLVTNASGTVPTGDYLALKVLNSGGVSHSVTTDGDSRLQAPNGSPSYPLPEVPAGLLFGLGCGVIVACVFRERMTGKRKASAPISARR